ncbi:MAG TPA: type II secretion system F family protein [Pirellulales bacterium]|jgi:general secretion pathway protein F
MAAGPAEPIGKSAPAKNLSLDELIALTDEMAALVHAGVPLEKGLAQVAVDLNPRTGNLAADLATRMQAGESLPHALAASPKTFSPIYLAVVDAGLRSGRLSAALEGLANSSRRIAELRRLARVAILYPVFVAFLAFGLFVAGLVWFQPYLTQTYGVMELSPAPLNLQLADLGRTAPSWAPWIPLVAFVVLMLWWMWSKRATTHSPWLWRFTPGSRLLYYSHLATFADLLALLIEHCTPLDEAIVLAADAGGDKRLKQSARQFAQLHAAGITPNLTTVGATAASPISGLPPLVSWLLIGGGTQPALVESLRNTSQTYQRRVQRLDDWLRLYLPLCLIVGIGGTAVVIYALTLLGPWYQMLTHIGDSLR